MKKININTSSICPHKCKYCHYQNHNTGGKLMKPEEFYKIFDIVKNENFKVLRLFNNGECFLNPYIYDYIDMAADHNFRIFINTKYGVDIDFSRLTYDKLEITVAVDDITQKQVDKVTNISIRKVFENLRKTPKEITNVITTINRFNEDRLHIIEKEILSLGLNWRSEKMGIIKDFPLIREVLPSKENIINHKRCFIDNPIIDVDGNLTICCHDMESEHIIGNVIETGSVRELLKTDLYVEKYRQGKNHELNICKNCNESS